MSNFPTDYDDDTTLPVVNNNITEIGGDAINATRDAIFNIETNIGLGAQGSTLSIAERLGVSIMPDGYINPSAITALGLVSAVTGVFNSDVNPNAAIAETKLKLDHRTQDLFNYIRDLSSDVNTGIGWISTVGIKLEPHLLGAIYRHTLDQIDVIANPDLFLKNKFRTLRNNSDSFQVVNDINNEFLAHQWADGSDFGTIANVTTNNGSVYPSNYAHTASGLFLDTSRFSTIPQTAQDLQAFAQFIDSSSIFLYGTRIQNLYSNGISRVSRSSNLAIDGYGPALIPPTTATAYLQNTGMASSPLDDIDTGDDIIEFTPSSADKTSFSFDEKFALVKPGDILRINYGSIEVAFIIKEKKYISNPDPNDNRYVVRIAGKNLFATSTASARIDRSLVNSNKFGVLSLGSAQILNGGTNALTSPAVPSLIVGTPRGAMALGLGFNPDQFDNSHYNLYLALFSTGFPQDGYTILPAIDVTGNAGATPGKYTLDSIVESTNRAFRRPGYNYRFTAFSYKGEFGIMLADSYNNAAFSIVSAAVDATGIYDQVATNLNLPNNVVGVFATDPVIPNDPLGFGPNGSAIASPPYMTTYGSSAAAGLPTKLFTALKRNNYYVDGTERDKLNLEVGQTLDTYGDGYWVATVDGYTTGSGKMGFTYKIPLNLSTSSLKIGKTLVVQGPAAINSGRFVITDITVDCTDGYTFVSVYDGVHATALSPNSSARLTDGTEVRIYFNSDSVSFNQESATDFSDFTPFKRHFEVYTDSQANTFTHERGRVYIGGASISINGVPLFSSTVANNFDIVRISPKLRGYQFGTVTKISLRIFDYDSTTGLYDGYLASTVNNINFDHSGPHVYGKIGEAVRFYDETSIDYIDVILDINSSQPSFTNTTIDFQLFPTLSLDDQIMMIGTCQLNDTVRTLSQIRDERQFGNTSEKEFSTSALDFIAAPARLLHGNGVISGFGLADSANLTGGQINLTGGTALVNGKFIQTNPQTIVVPPLQESNGGLYNINWALCIDDKGEYQLVPLLDKFGVLDASTGVPGNTDRIFTAFNIINAAVYTLDGSTFGHIASNRKDLTILYVVKSVVSAGPVFALTISDARKNIYSETLNIPFTWVPYSQDRPETAGHFNNIDSVITWVNMFGTNNTTIKVKGTFNVNVGPLDLSAIRNKVVFEGDGATFNVTTSIGIIVKQNIQFKNVNFNYNPTSFSNTGNINGDGGCVFGDTTLYDPNSQYLRDLTIEDCIFSSTTASHPPFICLRVSAGLVVDNSSPDGVIDTITIRNNEFFDTNDHPAVIAILNTYEDPSDSAWWWAPTVASVLIENNVCNFNQTIFIASTFTVTNTGALVDQPGISCFGVIIRNNTVGYIAYNNSGNNFFNPNSTAHKSSLVIEDNNCIAVISPVDSTGKVPINYITSTRNSYNHYSGTGNVKISNNTLNFISTVFRRVHVGSIPGTLRIINNKLECGDYASTVRSIFNFDAPADSTVIGVSGFPIGIYVDFITASTPEFSIGTFIEDNILTNSGTFWEGGIFSYVPCVINRNTMSGFNFPPNNATLAGVTRTFAIAAHLGTGYTSTNNTYAKITDNNIYRNGADFRSYVEVFGFTAGEVVDNFFDSNYKDVANTNLVLVNSPSIVQVDRNKNQVFTKYLRASDFGTIVETNHPSQVPPVSVGNPGGNDLTYPPTALSKTGFFVVYGNSQIVSTSINGSLSITMPSPTASVIHSAALIMPLKQAIPLGTHLFNMSVDYRMTADSTVTKTLDFYIFKYGLLGPFDAPVFSNTATDSTLDSGVVTLVPSTPATVNYPTFASLDFNEPYPWIQLYFTVSGATGGTSVFHLSDITVQYIY